MFKFLSNIFSKKAFYGAINYLISGTARWNERDFLSLAKEGYKVNPVAFACVDEIARAMSGITPWKLYKVNAKGERGKEVSGHEAMQVLANPNTEDTHADLVDGEARDYLIGGNGYQLIVERGIIPMTPASSTDEKMAEEEPLKQGSAIIGLWRIKPNCIRAVQAKHGGIAYFEIQMGAGNWKRKVHPSRIIHRKTYNPEDSPYGMSPMEAAARDIDTLNVGLEYNYGLLKNNGRPDGAVLIKGKSGGREKEKQAQAQVDGAMNEPGNVGKWKVFFGAEDMELKTLAITPRDMEFQNGRIASSVGVCTVYNVPPELVGIQGQKTYSNYQEARLAFYQETVLTHMDRLAAAYNKHWILPVYGKGFVLCYDKENIEALQEDRDKLWTRAGNAEGRGSITNNEFRTIVGLDPAADAAADVRMIAMSLIPAEDALLEDELGTAPGDDEPTDPEAVDQPEKQRRAIEAPVLRMIRGDNPADTFKAFDRRRSAWLLRAIKLVKATMAATYRNVAEEIKAIDGQPDQAQLEQVVRHAVNEMRPLWNSTYAKIYMGVGLDFANAVDRGLGTQYARAAGGALEQKATPEIEAAWTQKISTYLRTEGGKKIDTVSHTTRTKIMNSLAEGLKAGDGADVMAASVSAASRYQTARSLTIARTEVISASNLGSDTAARSFGIPLNKSWLDTGDGPPRERETHMEAGQTQQGLSLNEAFELASGAKLMFPGDTSLNADASETINCRCTQVYEAA